MSEDQFMAMAMEEVDALTPSVPPMAPYRFAASLIGTFVDGRFVVQYMPDLLMFRLSDGSHVSMEWVVDNRTSPPRVENRP